MSELSPPIQKRIETMCAEGELFAKNENYRAALEKYWAAWDLLPKPETKWDAATWILGAIGEANFLSNDFSAGRDNLSLAMHCPGATGNPFLHLLLGQCEFELGNLDRAADELTRAYMGAGRNIFVFGDKYFAFLKTRIKPPSDGW